MPANLSADAAPPAIQVIGLRKTYREGERVHVVLDGIDLSIAPRERVAIVGPSGSGKSTLLNLIGGIDRPDAGEVRLGGKEVSALSESDRTLFRRKHLGFVFQFLNLIPTLTVIENLLLPLELNGEDGQAARDRAASLLAEVGLADRADALPDRLSGGEQQRVAVARALAHRPQLVLADEPTGNLDEDSGAKVITLLERLVESDERTLVLVTHSVDLAARMDRVLRVSHGKVTEVGL
jgi:putative ABC transport system ATP-binding protein